MEAGEGLCISSRALRILCRMYCGISTTTNRLKPLLVPSVVLAAAVDIDFVRRQVTKKNLSIRTLPATIAVKYTRCLLDEERATYSCSKQQLILVLVGE